jgi:flagellar L-ring protein precursor FlgH
MMLGCRSPESRQGPGASHRHARCRWPAPRDRASSGIALLPVLVHLSLLTCIAVTACVTAPPRQPQWTTSVPTAAATATVPAPALPTATEEPSPGSLWTPQSGSLWQDVKARRIGDIVTITVSEKSEASKKATTKTGRTKELSGDLSFAGLTAGDKVVMDTLKSGYQGKFEHSFDGNGLTSKSDTMSAYMTATVVDVLPNGNLVIRGSRWTKVNDELQQIVLEGVIRPMDISRSNEVLSQKIADAKIFFIGKGPVSTQQKPGWLGQLWDVVNPF